PLGSGRLRTQAKEAEGSYSEYHSANIHGCLDYYRRYAVGYNMPKNNSRRRGSYCLCRFYKLPFPDGHRLTSNEPRIPRPPGYGDGQHCIFKTWAKKCSYRYGQQQGREA